MVKYCKTMNEVKRKFVLLIRKSLIMRKHCYIITILQFLIAIIFTLQIRLMFEPQALRLKRHESSTIKDILKETPKDVKYQYSPNNHFLNSLMNRVSNLLNIKVTPIAINKTLNEEHSHVKSLWVIFMFDGDDENIVKPMRLEYKIRSYDFNEGAYAIWNEDEPSKKDPYMASGFMHLQLAIDISFLELWNNGGETSIDFMNKIWIGRFPYHTLNLLVMPVLLEPSVKIAYYLTIIAFISIPVEVLHRVVHDKKKGLRELMHVMGMSHSMLYTGWLFYMMIIALPTAAVCTVILNPILANAYPLTIFLFILLYLTMSTFFMLFVGTFFRDTLKACLVGTFLWFTFGYLSTILADNFHDTNSSLHVAALFLPHNGLLNGLFNFAERGDTIKFDNEDNESSENINNTRSYYPKFYTSLNNTRINNEYRNNNDDNDLIKKRENIPSFVIIISWLLHIVLWMLMTLYFDKLKPGKLGAAKPWYFPCKRLAPRSLTLEETNNAVTTTKWSTVERTPAGLTPVVTIRQITKTFGSRKNRVTAIDGMTIDFYDGEFHIIIGHNGAGKSTLLKMIVGIYKPSRGKIYILGRDYERVKNLIGYCPQDNILVNDLTAVEHVYIFGMVKGMLFKDTFEKAESILGQLGLAENLYKKVKNFSIGMKRRVCLSMALIGNSKILVLDEPGYGVDPQNRRRIWDTLLAFKEHRTIIMTTNSMEAADILPDRIAIIAGGRVECYGSKMYLNRRFGVAYLLSIVIEDDCDTDNLTNVIQNYSSYKIDLRSRLGSVVKYDLPRKTAFSKLIHHLENNINSLRIKSLGLSVTSIEEQFRRIGFKSNIKMRNGLSNFYNDRDFEMMIRKRRQDLLTKAKKWERKNGRGLYGQQIGIMIYKKCLHVANLWNVYGYTLLFSLVTFILFMEIARTTKIHIMTTRVNEVNVSKYIDKGLRLLIHSDDRSKNLFNAFIETLFNYKENKKFTNLYDHSKIITATELITMPNWNSIEIRERHFIGIDIIYNNNINILYSVKASHSGPISLNYLHNSLLRYNGCEKCSIILKTEPILDPSQWQSRIIGSRGIINWQNLSIIVTMFLLIPSIYLIADESRSGNKKQQLNTIGISIMKYWLPIYIIDLFVYLLSLILFATLITIIYKSTSVVEGIEVVQIVFIFFIYGAAALPIGYIINFSKQKVEIVSTIIVILNAVTLIFINGSLTTPILAGVIPIFGKSIGDLLFHLLPQYVLGCSIGNYISIKIYNEQCKNLQDGCSTLFWSEDPCCQSCEMGKGCYRPLNIILKKNVSRNLYDHTIITDILILIFQIIFYTTIIIVIENRYDIKIIMKRYLYSRKKINPDLMETVIENDNNIVDQLITNRYSEEVDNDSEEYNTDVILGLKNLTKKFKRRTVVNGINLKLYRTECLGLLGINGAGKSTIFKMLTGEFNPTNGRAFIKNYDLINDRKSFSSMIGYCPQIGGLNDFMTARQNLRLHATLRGVPLDSVKDEVDKWLDVFDLLDYENIKVKHCPWGIRRKISILQSLIGDLPIVLLDEPTAGLDAIARQVVCDTLHFVRDMDRSLLVTTQSMEEAEILCLRIGVLVNGKFVAFGSSEQLKHRHGDYFELIIGIPAGVSYHQIEQVKKSIEEMFKDFQYKSLHAGILKYEVKSDETITYSGLFEKLEILKIRHKEITDFSINQTTMEQVFLSLCEKYGDNDNEEEEEEEFHNNNNNNNNNNNFQCISKFINRLKII